MIVRTVRSSRRWLALVVCLALAGCGSAGPRSATLMLDFVPNAVHAGIYRALAAGYYERAGIKLSVIAPGSTSDPLALIDAGRIDFALADGIDVAQQIAAGHDAVAIMAITQQPLGAVIALRSEHLRSPAGLAGKTVGITGVPSDSAVLDTVVRDAGGDPAKIHVVTIGFNGDADLEAGKLAAFTGYWPDDGVTVALTGHPVADFKLNQWGGPDYPGLVAFTTRSLIRREPALVRAFVAATVHGYEDTLRDPRRSLADLLRFNPAIEPRLARASLAAYLPIFGDGRIAPSKVVALSDWLVRNHLVAHAISPARFATNAFLP